MSSAARLVSAGAACIAVTFGLARYGYGLMLPDLRAGLDLDSATLGVIGSGSFAAYLLATATSGLLAARVGPR
jgi:sugar phosphate permease